LALAGDSTMTKDFPMEAAFPYCQWPF